jgi:hypothetical protein
MRTKHILLAATLFSGGVGAAVAQNTTPYDPSQLPAIQGKVVEYSLTPRGDVDGLILADGTQVHLPPHLGGELVQAVKLGETVTIRGLKAQAIPVIQALAVTNASGRSVVDSGPPAIPPAPLAASPQLIQVQGQVREPLYGPRGDMNGALLEDGTQVHLPPDQAMTMSASLAPGRTLVAQGYGVAGPYGKSVEAQQIGQSPTQMVQVGPPAPPSGAPSFGAPPPPSPSAAPPPPR